MNYPGLRTLQERYGAEGFNICAVPCNQFAGQAPLSNEEEREQAIKKFGFEFDVYDKIDVNESNAHPLYRYLKATLPKSSPGKEGPRVGEKGRIEWNYVKFLIDRNGRPVRRYSPYLDPLSFEGDVKLMLANINALVDESCLLNADQPQCVVNI